MILAILSCAAAFQGQLTTPVTPPGKKPPPSKPLSQSQRKPVPPVVQPPPLEFLDLTAGKGTPVKAGDVVVIHFKIQERNGPVLADSKKRGLPYTVKIGAAGNDPLLDRVLKGMKPGGTRTGTTLAKAVYGVGGAPPIISPGQVLNFTVTLLRRSDRQS